MTFSENLQFLRARQGLTQEQLAEHLEVSRQSVSKWESALSYPEMDTLLKLCDLFHTDLDTLLRGDAQQAAAEDIAGYDAFMTRFARRIAGAVAEIIAVAGIAAAIAGLTSLPEEVGGFVLLLGVTIATVVLIASGLEYDAFCKRWPTLNDFYTQDEKDAFQRRFVWYISGGVGAILFAVTALCLAFSFLPEEEPYESLLGTVLLLVVAGAVYAFIYGGICHDKYDIAKYNRTNCPTEEDKARRQRVGTVCAVIMLLATGVFLFLGLNEGRWNSAAVIYPVAGVLCGIAAVVLGPKDPD